MIECTDKFAEWKCWLVFCDEARLDYEAAFLARLIGHYKGLEILAKSWQLVWEEYCIEEANAWVIANREMIRGAEEHNKLINITKVYLIKFIKENIVLIYESGSSLDYIGLDWFVIQRLVFLPNLIFLKSALNYSFCY